MASNQPKRFGDRMRDLFKAREKNPDKSGKPPASVSDRVPFSTAVVPDSKVPAAQAQLAKSPPATVQETKKPDWRWQWGKRLAGKNKQPGQATVEQAKGPGPLPPLPPTTSADKGNVLLDPERLGLGEDKISDLKKASYKPKDESKDSTPKPPETKAAPKPPATAPISGPPPAVGSVQAPLPLGAQSVLAAQNGLIAPVQYVPVPVVTVPQPLQPPVPPPPNVPQSPQPAQFVNAFSSPLPPGQSPRAGQRPGYLPQASASGVTPAMFAPNPYAPYGVHPAMMQVPTQGYGPSTGPLGPRPMAMMNYQHAYQGPLPPNPMAPAMAASMPPQYACGVGGCPAMAAQMPPQYAMMPPLMPAPPMAQAQHVPNPAMDRPGYAQAGAQGVGQLLTVLRENPSPAQREMAVLSLASSEWATSPPVVEAMVHAARNDLAPSVRAGCCRTLAKLNAATEPILTMLQALKADPDQRVRTEAEQALTRLRGDQPANMPSVQPVRNP